MSLHYLSFAKTSHYQAALFRLSVTEKFTSSGRVAMSAMAVALSNSKLSSSQPICWKTHSSSKSQNIVCPNTIFYKVFFTSHLLLHLVPDILNSGALLLSLTLALSLSLAPPSTCSRAILTLSCCRLKLGT